MKRKCISKQRSINYNLNQAKSEMAEDIIAEYYSEKGWKVIKCHISRWSGRWITDLNYDGLDKTFKDNNAFKVKRDISIVKEKLGKDFHYPDFICEKEEEIMFVEVKSFEINREGDVKQKETLEELRKLGYTTIITSFPISQDTMFKILNSDKLSEEELMEGIGFTFTEITCK